VHEWVEPADGLRRAGILPTRRSWYRDRGGKRLLDVLAAAALLALLAPLMVMLGILVWVESPGPPVFRQRRVGRGGQCFTIYKLRTMRAGADDVEHRALMSRLIRNGDREVVRALVDDPRLTRVGRWLRRTCLDELPQLFNVLSGSRSLVGPRPCLAYELALYEPWQRERLEAMPGLTGPWQVHGRGRVTYDEMVAMDIDYTRKLWLRTDLAILLRTPHAALRGPTH
jgi:lipopolysaccharide/colanic/teichoic acid biosynthesis glycosyltransferase